ncbi:MAG: NAD(P)H-dependent oxidoreductase [Candidatus Anaerobiospirillum merdipullorum]|uniref:NAD(P)H-dependent oxidoreductase n=1 Tax=Candidatus Anaerobiospirillum merdipullorum TaxID=2838450 RepID=A0A9E2NTR8_9GAMM|nr:NAD(P)H-dependent oxidoreductase [Candidatus Anaerobiospirillum merdipullorum]
MFFKKLLMAAGLVAATVTAVGAQAADFSQHKTAVVFYSLIHNREGGDDYYGDRTVGNTEHLADLVVTMTGADKFSLEQVEPYGNDYDAVVDKARSEQEQNVRPKLKSIPDLSSYDVVFVAYPCWWGSYPMAFATLFDTGALNGKVVIPLTTHEGSRWGHSIQDLQAALPQSTILEGYQHRGRSVFDEDVKTEMQEFLQDLELPQ